MLKIKSDGTIEMSRGDSVYVTVNLYDSEGNPYILKETDKLFFSAKKKATDKNYAIPPVELGGENRMTIGIEPEMTADLQFGEYWYDVQLVSYGSTSATGSPRCNTVVKPSKLIINEVITAFGDR